MALFGAILGGLLSYGAAKKQGKAADKAAQVQQDQLNFTKDVYKDAQAKEAEWYKTFGFIDENIADFAQSINSGQMAQYKTAQYEQAFQKMRDQSLAMLSQRGYEVGNGIEAGLTLQIQQNKQMKLAELKAMQPYEDAQTMMNIGNYAWNHKTNPYNLLGNVQQAANGATSSLNTLANFYGQRANSAAQFGGQLAGAFAPVLRPMMSPTVGNVLFGAPNPVNSMPTPTPNGVGYGGGVSYGAPTGGGCANGQCGSGIL